MDARSRAPYQPSAEDITQCSEDYEDSASETYIENCEPSRSQKQNWPRLPPDSVKRMASMEKTVTDYRNSSRVPEQRCPTLDAHRSGRKTEETVTDYSNRSRYEPPYQEQHEVAAQKQVWPGGAVPVNPRSWELTEPMPAEHRQRIMGNRRAASKSERNHIVSKSGYNPRSTYYPTDFQGIPRQTSGRGCDNYPKNYRQQSAPKTKYCIKESSVSSYEQQPGASYESRNGRDARAQTYCEPCNATAPKSAREQKPCEVCGAPSAKQRRESYYDYYDEPPPASQNRNKSRQDGYYQPQPKPQSTYSIEFQPAPGSCSNEAPSCSNKQKQSRCPPCFDSSDYMEDRERQQNTYRNPLVVKSAVCIPQQPPKSKVPETCPAYRKVSPKQPVSCECYPPVRPKPRPDRPPRPQREFCTNSPPSDYMAHQRASGVFNRNPLTTSSCDVKIHSCGRPQPPVLTGEAMNERQVKGQYYAGTGRGNAPREPSRASPYIPPKNPSQDTARKCKPCNKPPNSRPKKTAAAKNPSVYGIPQFQQRSTEADHSLYVPPSCFAPTPGAAKKKRTAYSKRGRSSSGFTVKPTISIHKTRRKIKAAKSVLSNRWQCPKCSAQRQNVLRKPSGFCGAEVKNRSKPIPAKVKPLGSKLTTVSGYNMIPFPNLTRLNLNRRIPRLTPTYPHRCQGGKLTPTSTRVVKARHKVNQNDNSMNSMATARNTARRVATETRRNPLPAQAQAPAPSYRGTKTTSTTVRRDLPPRYQPTIQTTHRPVQVAEEAAHSSPRRSQIVGSSSQMTRQPNVRSSIKPQRAERGASRVHSEKKTVSIRQANPGNPTAHPDSGHSLSSRSTNSRPAAHDIPHRVQEGSRSSTPSKPRSHALPRVSSENREHAATPTPEHPHFSGHSQAQKQPVIDSRAQQFYRGSFLSIRPTLSTEPVLRAPPRPRGSLIMIAQKGLSPQVLKRAIPKGSSFIVPNKWQCMGKMNGFLGTNHAIPERPYSNWRKIIHWFLHGNHYMNSSQCHPTLGNPNPLRPPDRSEGFQRSKSRFAFITELQASQQYKFPMVYLKPSMTNRFVLGQKRRSLDYFAQLGRSFGGEQDKKPELLHYLGKDLRCCAVCGQEEERQINGICPGCYKKIQGALHNFKKQQLKESVKAACCCASNCKEEQYDKELEHQRRIKEKHREEKQRELDEKLEQQKENGTPPFSIIVLQDCNNNLINQLTAALAASCTTEKPTRQQQQQSNSNSPANDNQSVKYGNADNYNANQNNWNDNEDSNGNGPNNNNNNNGYNSGRIGTMSNNNNSGNNFYTSPHNNNTPNNNITLHNNSPNSGNNSAPSYNSGPNNNNWRYGHNNQGNYNNNNGSYNSNNTTGNFNSVSGNCYNSMGNSMGSSQHNNDNNWNANNNSNSLRMPENKNKPTSLNCTCNCAACRLGYENTLKLPMLMAQALEIFVRHNSPESAKESMAKSSYDGGSSKGSKNSISSKASPSSLKDKSKAREGNKEAAAAPSRRRSLKRRKNRDVADSISEKSSKKARKAAPEQQETATAERGKDKSRKSNIGLKAPANSEENKTSNKSRDRNNARNQANGGSKPKSTERFRANAGRGKQRSREQKKSPEGKKSESMFFLPESDCSQCRSAAGYTGCQPACSSQKLTTCAFGCGCANCRCTAGCYQCKLGNCLHGGAGDQANRLSCPRSFIHFNGCVGCSNCGAYSRPSPPRELMHPVAHFRPGVNLYPANLIINRSGDSVRQSVVRTAAGVTLHAMHRQEQEGQVASDQPYPRFPGGSNNQFWR